MRGAVLYEPFGLVALEAMASGCPCIVADTGGLREVVPAGERVGLRFNGGDAEHLGVMIERLLTDAELRDRLVAEASEHVLRFDWADIARQTAAVYGELRKPPIACTAIRGTSHPRARAASDLPEWPDDQAPNDEGPETKLGPSEVVHQSDGGVTVGGEEVDDPDEYEGEPIPGGPTDPDAPRAGRRAAQARETRSARRDD